MPQKKIGRPKSDKPKVLQMSVRFDEDYVNILEEYCIKTGKTKTDAIREGIKKLKE